MWKSWFLALSAAPPEQSMQWYLPQRQLSRFASGICPLFAPQATQTSAWWLWHTPSRYAERSDGARENMALNCPTFTFFQPDSWAVFLMNCVHHVCTQAPPAFTHPARTHVTLQIKALLCKVSTTSHSTHHVSKVQQSTKIVVIPGNTSSKITSVTKFTVTCSFLSLIFAKR